MKKKFLAQPPSFRPVAVVDIGSNSVRIVVYDGLRRSPSPVFNEKVLCGLGKGIALTGALNAEGIERALLALRRFRAIIHQIGASEVFAVATAAAREAANGADFIKAARDALGYDIRVLSGKEEARLAAQGVAAGIPEANGIVGDLGGGSLELIDIRGGEIGAGITLPLGPLRLMDITGGDLAKATAVIDKELEAAGLLADTAGRGFYAVGGAWRNMGRLHMDQNRYPLHVLHQYTLPRGAGIALAELVASLKPGALKDIDAVSSRRADTLPMAALVLARTLKASVADNLVMSVYGLREGLLFSKLKKRKREADPLLSGCWDFARRYARSPRHELELTEWTDQVFEHASMRETAHTRRLRHAACMLADIGWRSHPDYRGTRSLNLIAQATLVGVDHPGRIFLALTIFFRYEGVSTDNAPKELVRLIDDDMLDRARQLSGAFRLAYVLSAAMPGMLPKIGLQMADGKVVRLVLPRKLADLQGEVVTKRLSQFAQTLGRTGQVVVEG